MHTSKGQVVELILEDGYRYARVSCTENMIPTPGQYLLAGDAPDSPLPVPVFYTDSAPQSFITIAGDAWKPGDVLYLRGPLGRGFALPISARKIGLVAFDDSPARLRGLIRPALKQNASVVLVCDSTTDSLPDELEVQPLSALEEIVKWADYLAMDVERERLNELRERLGERNQLSALHAAQLLIRTPMPCGGVAECGICAVTTKSGWKIACKDGPVFNWREI
jgi:NAD(P)H-flavin reductase